MGLSREQRRAEQLWWTRDLIEDLIIEKCPGFLGKHENADDLIKQFEPEIMAEFNRIANKVIASADAKYAVYVEGKKVARVDSLAEARAIVASYDNTELICWCEKEGDRQKWTL